MPQTSKGQTTASDVEEQIKTIRDDITKLTRMMVDLGEGRAADAAKMAQSEAEEIIGHAKRVAGETADKARQKAASAEDFVVQKPIQSAFIALLVGIFIGSMSRR